MHNGPWHVDRGLSLRHTICSEQLRVPDKEVSSHPMTPLELEKDEKFSNIRGLIFDVDDTITRNGVLEKEAFSAIHRLAEAGVTLIAATGRPVGFVEIMVRQWPISLGIGENGAAWVLKEASGLTRRGYFWTDTQKAEEATRQLELQEKLRNQFPEFRITQDSWARECDLAYDIAEYDQHTPERIAAFTEAMQMTGAIAMVSSVHAHATFQVVNKALGVEKAVREVYGEDLQKTREHWVFVGDSGNDAAAFAYFRNTVGVANIREHLDKLKVRPRWITQKDYGQGFAELAERLLRARDL